MFGLGIRAGYHRCRTCASLSIVELPADTAALYPKDYYAHAPRQAGAGALKGLLDRLTGTRSRALEATLRVCADRKASLLDVGCGRGELLEALAARGFKHLLGIDPYLSESTIQGNGFRLLRQEVREVGGAFDLITLHHVLEHLADPGCALADARARLTPRGRILVRVPLADSLAFRRFGAHWVQLDAPRHFAIPSQAGLAACAAKAGLAVRRVWFDSTSLQFWGSRRYLEGKTMMRSGTIASGKSLPGKLLLLARICEDAARAALLNRTGGADQGCFLLAPLDSP